MELELAGKFVKGGSVEGSGVHLLSHFVDVLNIWSLLWVGVYANVHKVTELK